MADFKKGNRFGGGNKKGPFTKSGFNHGASRHGGGFRGAVKRDFSGPVEMHQATCAHCGKSCEVPFRPNGKKPVFCKECFANGSSKSDFPSKPFSHSDAPARPAYRPEGRAEGGERRGSDLYSQVELLHSKVDTLMRMLEALGNAPQGKDDIRSAPQAGLKAVLRKVAKKAVKK